MGFGNPDHIDAQEEYHEEIQVRVQTVHSDAYDSLPYPAAGGGKHLGS